jgi:opacity protein-like surface antigen
MKRFKLLVLAGLAVCGAGTSALAADIPRRILPPAPAVPVAETWYLRGDIGYAHHHGPSARGSYANAGVSPLAGDKIRGAGSFGIGAGYRFSPMFRADVTADIRTGADFKGSIVGGPFDRAHFQSAAFLVNGYVDVGTWYGFTPYVGAGIGLSRNVMNQYTRSADGDPTNGVRFRSDIMTGLAWALMTGVAVDLTPGLKADLGYRYLRLGDVKAGAYTAGDGVKVRNIGAHEFRVGLRYFIN